MEHLTGPLSPLSADDVPAIVRAGALVRRGAGRARRLGAASSGRRRAPATSSRWTTTRIGRLAACWDAVGRATAEHGVRTALHVDFLSALRRDHVPALLDRTDPALVGLALDTGELTVGGIDPVDVIQRYGDRIVARAVQGRPRRRRRRGVPAAARALDGPRARAARGRSRAGSPSPAPTAGSSTSRRSPARCSTSATPAGSSSRATRARTPPPAPCWPATSLQRELRPILEKGPPDGHRRHRPHRRQPDPAPEGLGIALTVPWYRSLWLSSVTDIAVAVEGRAIPTEDLRVELGERTYRVDELADQWDILWFIQDRLVVVVPLDEPVGRGPGGRRRGDRRPAAALHADRAHEVRDQPRQQPPFPRRAREDPDDHHRTRPRRRARRSRAATSSSA